MSCSNLWAKSSRAPSCLVTAKPIPANGLRTKSVPATLRSRSFSPNPARVWKSKNMNGCFTDQPIRLCLFSILFTLSLAAPAQPANSFRSVYISEFLADNQHGLKDEDGECSPWIELYNGGRATINLNG